VPCKQPQPGLVFQSAICVAFDILLVPAVAFVNFLVVDENDAAIPIAWLQNVEELVPQFWINSVAIKKSDIQLFWAYQAPKELNLPRWSGGWILLPHQKR
jgi:hypothetical protein